MSTRLTTVIVSCSMLIITIAELMIALDWEVLGIILDAGVIVLLFGQYLASAPGTDPNHPPRVRDPQDILPALSLIPLLRILSLALPNRHIPDPYWNIIIAIPLFVGMALTISSLRLHPREIGFQRSSWRWQAAVAGIGIPAGALGYLFLQSKTKMDASYEMGIISLILIMVAALEEVIFRGVLRHLGLYSIGTQAIVWLSVVYASLHLSSGRLGYVLLLVLLGIVFSAIVTTTGSIWGVIAAHSVMDLGMAFVWPSVAEELSHVFSDATQATARLVVEGILVILLLGVALWLFKHPLQTNRTRETPTTSQVSESLPIPVIQRLGQCGSSDSAQENRPLQDS